MRKTTLFVAGFGKLRAKELAYEFERFGRLVRCDIPAPKSATAKSYAFVEFEDDRDASDAYYEMHGRRLDGDTLNVQWAKNAPSSSWRYERRSRSPIGGGSRRCRSPSPYGYSSHPPADSHYHHHHRSSRRSPSPYHRHSSRGGGAGGSRRSRSPVPSRRSPTPLRENGDKGHHQSHVRSGSVDDENLGRDNEFQNGVGSLGGEGCEKRAPSRSPLRE